MKRRHRFRRGHPRPRHDATNRHRAREVSVTVSIGSRPCGLVGDERRHPAGWADKAVAARPVRAAATSSPTTVSGLARLDERRKEPPNAATRGHAEPVGGTTRYRPEGYPHHYRLWIRPPSYIGPVLDSAPGRLLPSHRECCRDHAANVSPNLSAKLIFPTAEIVEVLPPDHLHRLSDVLLEQLPDVIWDKAVSPIGRR